MLLDVEPDLRAVIQTLRDGNLEVAKDRTVALIECTCRMSGPMYRDESMRGGPRPAGNLRDLTRDLREVSFTMRRGTQRNALQLAERALTVFLGPANLPVK